MKPIMVILFLFSSCASSEIKIYNQSDRFIDIEVNRKNFWFECSLVNPKDKKSLMSFYMINGEIIHQFIFRRLSNTKDCLKWYKEYEKIIDGINRVRLVGIDRSEKEKNYLIKEKVPDNFKKPKFLINWFFVRLETSKGCESYFDNGCTPENYWGGLYPQN